MTRALILAAGQGTRLRPLTDNTPKCLVPFLGEPLLSRQVKTLRSCGVNDIAVATGYKSEQIEALGFPCFKNEDFASTNMVETLLAAEEFIRKEGDLIIAYGDIIYQKNNLQTLLNSDADIALMIDVNWRSLWELRLDTPLDDAETLKMDSAGHVKELGKKPDNYEQVQGQYTGLIKIKSEKIEDFLSFYYSLDKSAMYDGKDFKNMYMTSFLQGLIDADWKVKAALVKGGWLEVDSVDDLEAYESMYTLGKLQPFYDVDGE